MKLLGKVAIVIGGGAGIGLGITEKFLAEGARVAVLDIDPEACKVMRAEHGLENLLCFVGDVRDDALCREVVAAVVVGWGSVDVLVIAAAADGRGRLGDTSDAEFGDVIDTNIRGSYIWIREVLQPMIRQQRGSIVTISSQLALSGGRGHCLYVTSKAAVTGMTRSVALDYADDGIRANILVPGATEGTTIDQSFARWPNPEERRERSKQRHAMHRFGTIDEVANGALFLASDDSSFTTGAILPVDGGWHVN